MLPNRKTFPKGYMTKARELWREDLGRRLKDLQERYQVLLKYYDSYGINNPSMRRAPLKRKSIH